MACGCTDKLNNKKLNNMQSGQSGLNSKLLSLEYIKELPIDDIINLYRQGYILDDTEITALEVRPEINIMTYTTQCSGNPEVAFNSPDPLLETYGTVQKGDVWAQRFYGNFRCLDFVQFYMERYANVNFYIEIRRDDGIGEGKPVGVPLVDDSGLIMRTSSISYGDIPAPWGWAYLNVGAILPTDGYYWICFVPSDFSDSPIYRDPAYDRFGIRDGFNISDKRAAHYAAGSWTNSSTFAFVIYKLPSYSANCELMSTVTANPTTGNLGDIISLSVQASPSGIYTVQFFDSISNTVLATDTASVAKAAYSAQWQANTAGTYQVKARVVGQCESSSSTQVTISCSPNVSGVTANPTAITLGQQVTLTSMVIPSGAYTVQFIKTDGTVLASETSQSSKSSYSAIWTPSAPGIYDIRAKTSTQPLSCANQPVETVTVNPVAATCQSISNVTPNPPTATIGDFVNLSANITPNNQAFNVDFKEGGTILGSVIGAIGTATYNWNTAGKSAGGHNIIAYIGGTSPCQSPSPVTVTLNNPSGSVGAVRFHVNCGGTTCDTAHILLQGIEKGLTGPDGTVVVQNIPVGSRTFTIRKTGYSNGSVTVNVVESVTTDANLVTLSGAGGGSGIGMLLGLVGIAALGVMITASKPKTPKLPKPSEKYTYLK